MSGIGLVSLLQRLSNQTKLPSLLIMVFSTSLSMINSNLGVFEYFQTYKENLAGHSQKLNVVAFLTEKDQIVL